MLDNSKIGQLLFGLSEVTKDTDNFEMKKNIRERISNASNADAEFDAEAEITFIQNTVSDVSKSFEKRKKQMLTDAEIVNKINMKIDEFREEHKAKVNSLLASLMSEIDAEVDKHSDELVRMLDPHTIKERYSSEKDFNLLLERLNASYADTVNKTADRKAQSAIRSYVFEMEDVFETAMSYISERETVLDAEDMFYGTLATSKNVMTQRVSTVVNEMSIQNRTLYEASEELFNGIWEARRKYDMKRHASTAATVAIAGGAIVAVAGVSVLGVALAFIGMVFIGLMAKDLFKAIHSPAMERDVQLQIEKFKQEAQRIKIETQSKLTQNITQLFDDELVKIDKAFLKFRTITAIDQRNVALLETKLTQLEEGIR
ncbi:MAG: hypothetical protein FWC70_11485 [Defluviitaleaceae bacterium]|nr:hypothetical protein [Defluviitaleaceae bacterium]